MPSMEVLEHTVDLLEMRIAKREALGLDGEDLNCQLFLALIPLLNRCVIEMQRQGVELDFTDDEVEMVDEFVALLSELVENGMADDE